jgi:hypothetical protein
VKLPGATHRVVTCRSAAEARAAMGMARRILKQLGVELHPQKTRIVHVRYGFEFLGYKIKCGWRKLSLPGNKIRSRARQDALYAYPKEKSISRFMDKVRQRTKRTTPLRTEEVIAGLNPPLRGWGEYYKRAHVHKLFQRLDGWILRRIWSHRYRRWRNAGWKRPPATQFYGEYELVRLIYLNSFSCILASLSLRESCLHEMCTGSLGGGRRLARKCTSSDPTKLLECGDYTYNLVNERNSAGRPPRDFQRQ